jgi:hypothetical protein
MAIKLPKPACVCLIPGNSTVIGCSCVMPFCAKKFVKPALVAPAPIGSLGNSGAPNCEPITELLSNPPVVPTPVARLRYPLVNRNRAFCNQ